MLPLATRIHLAVSKCGALFLGLAAAAAALLPDDAGALPLFARQTGQNCLSCHAGGQFPELTPYGRKFKLTGYTMGERATVPLAVMAVASSARVASTAGSTDPEADFPHNGRFEFTTASLLCCGKITDNLGLFAQWTYDRFDHLNGEGRWVGKSHVDQVDLRYADRFIDSGRDLIVGASLNNSPGVTDVWNTFNNAFTPVPTYVPVGNPAGIGPFVDVAAAPIDQQLGQATAGASVYAFWNNTLYGELGAYKTAEGVFSAFNAIHPSEMTWPPGKLKGANPYWRLALNHDWGAHSAMLGMHGMNVEAYANSPEPSGPTVRYRDLGVDGQYQYILDPHVVTAMFSYTRERQRYADELVCPSGCLSANSTDSLDYLRLKLTYVFDAKYGASLAYTSVKGSPDSTLYQGDPAGGTPFGSANNTPDTRLFIPELFWNPVQYVRVGVQYYKFSQYNGAANNYDGNGRNASDNNTLFFYVWAAY